MFFRAVSFQFQTTLVFYWLLLPLLFFSGYLQSSFVKVKLNETSKKICRLNYNKVFAVRPIRREEMYRKDMYGKIINFCKKIKDRNEKNGCFKDLNLSSCLDDWCELAD